MKVSLGGIGVAGFALGQEALRMLPYAAGEVWNISITADRPVSADQFMSLAEEINTENWDVLQFMPIDQTHFSLIVRWRQSGTVISERDITWDGIKYTIRPARAQQESDCDPNTSVWDPATRTCKFKTVSHELATTTNVSPSDTSSYTPEKKLSTGAIVGITLAGAVIVGGGIYLWRAA